MPRAYLAVDVFEAAYNRVRMLYDAGERIVVSSSGGKDSTVVVELCIMAARDTGRLPVEVVMRDEEIMMPGTFEYLERLAARTHEVDFHWVIAGQPIVNIFNRNNPYFWVFDQTIDPDEWVRKWPGFDRGNGPETTPLPGRQPYWIDTQNISGVCSLDRFPPLWPQEILDRAVDKHGVRHATGRSRDPNDPWVGLRDMLWTDRADAIDPVSGMRWDAVQGSARKIGEGYGTRPGRVWGLSGLRTSESPRRMMGLMVRGAWLSWGANTAGLWDGVPIYDWKDEDVYKFLKDHNCDYNHAYDVLRRMGVPKQRLRIAPPTLTSAGLPALQAASKAWPQWFDRVAQRLDGVRSAAQFGRRAITPYRRLGETWEECFYREIIEPPHVEQWIKERAMQIRDVITSSHARHATGPLPDQKGCPGCVSIRCWSDITTLAYLGDPIGMKASFLKPLEPEFFRKGAGVWGGDVAFA